MDDRCLAKIKEGSFDGNDDYVEVEYMTSNKHMKSNRRRNRSDEDDDQYDQDVYYNDEYYDEDEEVEYQSETLLDVPRLIIILDATGSMKDTKSSVLAGYNDFLEQARQSIPDSKLTVVKFAQYMKISNYERVSDAPDMTDAEYVTRGQTLMHDTLGCTLEAFSNESGNMVQVYSDGLDNKSTIFDEPMVAEAIDNLKNEGWQIAITSTEEVARRARRMGFTNVISFKKNGHSMRRAFSRSGKNMFSNRRPNTNRPKKSSKNLGASRGTLSFNG